MVVEYVKIPEDGIKLKALGDRYYSIVEPTSIRIGTDIGAFQFNIREGFVTNFRSGAPCIDRFIDQIGDRLHQVCWLVHDCCYTPCINRSGAHAVDRKTADDLLFALLRFAGETKFKARVVWTSVRMFGSSAYNDDDAFTFENYKRLEITYISRRVVNAYSSQTYR